MMARCNFCTSFLSAVLEVLAVVEVMQCFASMWVELREAVKLVT